MSKLIIRITIILTALYLISCYFAELLFDTNIWSQNYYLLFELCVCLCISKQGVYHCKFIKYTAYGILASDTLVCIDNVYDIFPVDFMVFVPAAVIAVGLGTTTTLAIRHYFKVRRFKKRWQNNSRQY